MGMKVPRLVLDDFSGDPLEWPEWSGQFLSTVDEATVDENVQMEYLKTLVTGKPKAAIEGMGYNGAMYHQPNDVKDKRLTHIQRYDPKSTVCVFGAWMKNIAEAKDKLKMLSGMAQEKSNFSRDRQKTTFTSDAPQRSNVSNSKCRLKDGDHKIWSCPLFKKMTADERAENTRRRKLCFCCLNGGHRAHECSLK